LRPPLALCRLKGFQADDFPHSDVGEAVDARKAIAVIWKGTNDESALSISLSVSMMDSSF
jgi:hypothetical protein